MVEKKRTEKKDRSIPVKVSITKAVTPSVLPPLSTEALRPQASKQELPKKHPSVQPLTQARRPVHEWPEERRRQLMWWLVIGGATVIIIGWFSVIRFEMNGGSSKNFFSEAWQLIRSVNIGGSKKTTPAEKEIRQLDQQVFPQFSQ